MQILDPTNELYTYENRISKHADYKIIMSTVDKLQIYKEHKPKALLVIGPAGVGKTFMGAQLIIQYSQLYKSEKAVLYIDVSKHQNAGGIISELLDQLGAPKLRVKLVSEAQIELKILLKNLDTRLIIFDEVQDWLPKRGTTPTSKVYKFFKSFLNENKIPCLLLGTELSATLFSDDKQLKDRFLPTKALSPFDCKGEKRQLEFALILQGMLDVHPRNTEKLNFITKTINERGETEYRLIKSKKALLNRFCLATEGLMRRISNLLGECILQTSPSQEITEEVLAKAYRAIINEDKHGNPFTSSNTSINKSLKEEGLYA